MIFSTGRTQISRAGALANHEVGHAVVANRLGIEVGSVSVVPGGNAAHRHSGDAAAMLADRLLVMKTTVARCWGYLTMVLD